MPTRPRQISAALQLETLEAREVFDVVPLGAVFPINSFAASEQRTSGSNATAMAADGSYVVVWREDDDLLDSDGLTVMARRFIADGAADGGLFVAAQTRSGLLTSPPVAYIEDLFVVIWRDAFTTSSLDVVGQRFEVPVAPDDLDLSAANVVEESPLDTVTGDGLRDSVKSATKKVNDWLFSHELTTKGKRVDLISMQVGDVIN